MSDDLIKRSDAIEALRLEYPMMPMFKNLREEWAIKTEGFRDFEKIWEEAVLTADRKTEPQRNGYDKGWQLFADILFDKEKREQFLKECKSVGIDPQEREGE